MPHSDARKTRVRNIIAGVSTNFRPQLSNMYTNDRQKVRVKRWRASPFVISMNEIELPRHNRSIKNQVNLLRMVGDPEEYLRKMPILEQRYHHQLMAERSNKISSHFQTLTKYLFQWSKNFRQFCLETSLHGLRFVVEKEKTVFERVLWFVVLCVVYMCCGYLITNSVQHWLSGPVVMSMESKPISVATMPFPAVTVCNTNQIKPSVFNVTAYMRMREQLKNFINDTFLHQLDYANIVCQNHFDEELNAVTLDLKVFENMLNSAHETCQETYAAIKWMNETFRKPCEFMQPVLTEFGICYSFNMIPLKVLLHDFYYEVVNFYHLQEHKSKWLSLDVSDWRPATGYKRVISPEDVPRRTSGSGNLYSYTASIKINPENREPSCNGGTQGYTILVHSPANMPLSTNAKMVIYEGSQNTITIEPQLVRTDRDLGSWSSTERGCYLDQERHLHYYKLYTQTNCYLECESNYSLANCGCVAFYHPRSLYTPVCGSVKMDCIEDSLVKLSEMISKDKPSCDCLPACTTLNYDANVRTTASLSKPHQPSSMEIQPSERYTAAELNETEEYEKSRNITICTFSVTYENRETLGILRRALFTFSDFIGNIGGILGLFLGFSWISFLEIFYFIILRPILKSQMKTERRFSQN